MNDEPLAPATRVERPITHALPSPRELARFDGVATELASLPLPSAQGVLAATAILLGTLGAAVLFVGGLPLASLVVLSLCAVGSIGFGATVLRSETTRMLDPEKIVSGELRAQFRSVLLALDEVVRAAAEAPRLRELTERIVDRCRGLAATAGKLALLSNPAQRYLDRHAEGALARELERLGHRVSDTSDATTSAMLGRAMTVRQRQLALRAELVAKQQRLLARLEVVCATLEETAAAIVKMHVIGDEQAEPTGDAIEDLDGIADELDALASVFASDVATHADHRC